MQSVVHVTPYYLPHGGGIETHLQYLNRELINRGYQVSVLTTQHSDELTLEESMEGVAVYRIPVGINSSIPFLRKTFYKLNLWTEVLKRWRVLWKADVIHVHDVYWWLVPLLPLVTYKSFITFHGWEGAYPVPLKNKIQRWMWSKLAVRRMNIGTYLEHFYWEKPNRIIFGAVDRRFISTPLPSRKNKKPTVVYIGRLVAENEMEKYIALAKELKKSDPNIEIIWVGDGPYLDECAKVGKTVGFVQNVLPYLDQADVVLATSYLSTMQAQARGKVVCALNSHPLKKMTSTTFPTADHMLINDNIEEMKKLILELLKKPELMRAHGQAARKWVETQTWEYIADEYEKLWGTYG